ncbi:PREDICTED: interleukin-13 receptor subunit alpha-2 [Cercocebus atys]|uniref:Interleukin-13 receptor subunit alpha-2 n=1 Tax=Cercocebus atys TaxID=9531 RepID=A0A2K5MRS2_CERAT|nr:PREDICTED: interleukin-13 receptor subunit alpha-2 [Cercocebus atys]XP_011943044.1 PREDICTED: interleukin-13 receptor subunit alpha-2 [Cercocebus atys]XP_011943045.1 PREDICTED: interleukin-13 receptor subunit alpha-2 [Cercocebus atys]XP_011943046.1 PREDICTED: interleukin-13 receptor subunit alpha-2 [Cercocebus atys]XP_011943047.1 PREDICTED: interleukin-13 receptor subunit alpha-2 [Cercocebus atys]XP_011943048.1 PREDICTED: interleukin-13 receptor subunit alpha-2 [Cercocebus atys]XP_01194304
MAFVYLAIRCLCTFLISTTFGYTSSSDTEIKVNPPQDFEIVDPGYLGYLYLQWQPPLSLDNFKECTVEYELKYRNIGSETWTTIITKNLHYKDGFDLNKGIEAKIQTLLSWQCTNGSEVQSSWAEATYWISPQGIPETKVQDMDCVYYNWQYLLCSWKPGIGVLLDTNYNLFYWYEGLDHALQCVDYIKVDGQNIGCRFPYLESSDYKDFYICVNGSSETKPIRSSYFTFQLQNIVKPLPPVCLTCTQESLYEIKLKWSIPLGPIPARCFVYEIEIREDDTTLVTTTVENETYTLKITNETRQLCFVVRSKVNIYCSDDGIWSEWSEKQCWEVEELLKKTLLLFLLPFGFILILVIFVTGLLLCKRDSYPKMNFSVIDEDFPYQETWY